MHYIACYNILLFLVILYDFLFLRTSPASNTIILSTFTIVASLCAIKIDVFLFDIISIDFCIKLSVYVSMFAVASSNTNIDGLCAKILAKASNCF